MNSIKRRIIVFIATAFVASFFSNAAADNNLTGRARLFVVCVEAHLKDLRSQLALLDIKEDIAIAVRDYQEKVIPIYQEMMVSKKNLEKFGLSTLSVPAITLDEEQDSLQKIEEVRKEKEEVKKLELKAVKMLEEAIVLSQKAEEREK